MTKKKTERQSIQDKQIELFLSRFDNDPVARMYAIEMLSQLIKSSKSKLVSKKRIESVCLAAERFLNQVETFKEPEIQ